ncbi:MAG: TIGR01777 family oxidoreductase [Bacteroidales bacterium]
MIKIKTAGIRGASGLVGVAVKNELENDGWIVKQIPRNFSTEDIKGLDVVINLAGHSINCRWSEREKREIRESRINTTSRIVNAIKECGDEAPALLISASAVGIYPSSGIASPDSAYDEYSEGRGSGFLSELCIVWETEALKASPFTRVAIIRLGVVISSSGGAFPKLSLPFRLGLSVRYGSGKQPLSWISLEDVAGAVKLVINDSSIKGAVNLVAPQIIDMNGVKSTLTGIYRSLIPLHLTDSILKIAMGGSHELVTEGQNVKPSVLISKGYNFKHKTLGETISQVIYI